MSLDITPAVQAGTQIVQAYGDGGFRIANESFTGSVIVFPDRTLPLQATRVEDLGAANLQPILDGADKLDILVVGCGETFSVPLDTLRQMLREHGIVMEWMDTGAAARTFNVLMTEGRRAAAALIAVTNDLS